MTALAPPTTTSHASDFDFLFGTWRISNRRQQERLADCDEWDEFESTSRANRIWDGAAQIDEVIGETPSGPFRGMTVRLFDPASDQWRLYFVNERIGVLDPPLTGEFRDGRGEFYDQELFRGRSIYVRFVFSDVTATSCHWEQAFSEDGGKTWETNWIMDFTRTGS
jgi:hypothetical protein